MAKITPITQLTRRQRRIIVGLSRMKGIEVAEVIGISRQLVSFVKRQWDITPNKEEVLAKANKEFGGWEYKDTGCEDGKYLSCLDCPLKKCRYED